MCENYDFIIVGGGIAGTSCADRICNIINNKNEKILVISATSMVKLATNIKPVTKFLREFDVEDKMTDTLTNKFENLTIVHKYVSDLDSANHKLICSDGSMYTYGKLCIATGGKPKLISNNPHVIGIRDTETVMSFQKRLADARQIVLVGNGGIATELCYEIDKCKIVWAVKDDHISNVYFDSYAAKFFEKNVHAQKTDNNDEKPPNKRYKYTITALNMESKERNAYGSALGPDWAFDLEMKGKNESRNVTIEYCCEIKRIMNRNEFMEEKLPTDNANESWPVYVELTNDKVYGCDLVISATGVIPSVEMFTKNNKFNVAADGGIIVNDRMETSIQDIYAIGDACTAGWDASAHWFQMRLWNQASQMGDYAARSMLAERTNEKISLDFCFEMFAHITKFFGFKVILLGKYDARGLGNDYQLLLRCTEGVEFVKVVIHNGRVYGALLIGDTELEETFENLILNQIDVSALGENLLNPDIDIEDYFD